jgi:type II secretory pathway pseudopilin PulG
LLVVVSIIALLVGILLPAIGKAREQANLTKSQANIKQIGTALASYAAEFHDRQLTFVVDDLSHYGPDGVSAVVNYANVSGYQHSPVNLGYGQGGIWGYYLPPVSVGSPSNWVTIVPIDFATKFGSFRLINARQLNTYVNGRFYDPVFYAPKDTAVLSTVEPHYDMADEFNYPPGVFFSSYILSPAAMFSPDVFGLNKSNNKYFTSPFAMQGGFRSPAMSQSSYSNLKTYVIEHHWLQNRKKICNAAFGGNGTYEGCEPYYYNASWDSSPVVCSTTVTSDRSEPRKPRATASAWLSRALRILRHTVCGARIRLWAAGTKTTTAAGTTRTSRLTGPPPASTSSPQMASRAGTSSASESG